MSNVLWVVIIAAAALLWVAALYHRLVRRRSLKDEGWSGISVQLKRRHDLIPNLVATAKGLAGHEKEVLLGVTQARAVQAKGSAAVKEVAAAESSLTQALGRFLAVAENYPEIKASAAFQQVMSGLSSVEEDLQMARRYYNGTAREYNVTVESFPACLIAGMLGFSKADFFELDAPAEAAAPKVEF